MGRQWNNKSTNVRLSIPEELWTVLATWTVGEIPTPSLEDCACGKSTVAREGRCEQCSLEYELFHREERNVASV